MTGSIHITKSSSLALFRKINVHFVVYLRERRSKWFFSGQIQNSLWLQNPLVLPSRKTFAGETLEDGVWGACCCCRAGPHSSAHVDIWGLTSWVTALGHDCGWTRLASSFPVVSRNCSLIIQVKNTCLFVFFWRRRKLATKRILAGGLKLSYMGDNPSHWLSYVSRWLLHHQPVTLRFCRRVSFHYRSAPGCRSCAKRLWNIAKRQQAILFCLMMGMDQNMWKLKTFAFT